MLSIFLMNKILLVFFALYLPIASVLAWGDGGCFFAMKNNESQEETIKQVESSGSSDK